MISIEEARQIQDFYSEASIENILRISHYKEFLNQKPNNIVKVESPVDKNLTSWWFHGTVSDFHRTVYPKWQKSLCVDFVGICDAINFLTRDEEHD